MSPAEAIVSAPHAVSAAQIIHPRVSTRRPDYDALRVVATGAVFFFHCAKFFDAGGWHLTNRPTSAALSAFVEGVALWLMPLFFLLSGASTRLALQSRGPLRLMRDRVARLMLPFTAGVFFFIWPQIWVERVGHGKYDGSLLSFYPHYFEGWYGAGGNFAWMGLHLWYLLLLFIVTLLWLPVMAPLARAQLSKTLGIGALLIPVAVTWLVELLLIGQKIDFRGLGGWSVVQYPIFFFAGFLFAGDETLRRRLRQIALPALVIGGAAMIFWAISPDDVWIALGKPLARLIRTVASWGMLFAALGLGDRYLSRGRWIGPLNEASMPFYLVHQTAILLIALPLLSWEAPPWLKYPVLAALAGTCSAAITIVILRTPIARPLFGLKKAARLEARVG
jgi:glucan biosynthesis protein C